MSLATRKCSLQACPFDPPLGIARHIKDSRDMAEAARLYARAVGLGQDAMNEAAEVKLRAERMAGELLAEMKKNEGTKGQLAGRGVIGDSMRESPITPVPKLADIGITPKQSMNWQAEATVPEPVFEEWVEETKQAGEPLTTTALVRKARAAVGVTPL